MSLINKKDKRSIETEPCALLVPGWNHKMKVEVLTLSLWSQQKDMVKGFTESLTIIQVVDVAKMIAE